MAKHRKTRKYKHRGGDYDYNPSTDYSGTSASSSGWFSGIGNWFSNITNKTKDFLNTDLSLTTAPAATSYQPTSYNYGGKRKKRRAHKKSLKH